MRLNDIFAEPVKCVHIGRTPATPTLPNLETPRRGLGTLETLHEFSLDHVEVGDKLGKYELISRIGRGSTSIVFHGRHSKLLFPVAVKVLDATALANSPALIGQLESEAVLLAQLNHPNIVRLWDLDDEGRVPYLVLEYVAGGTLGDLISQKGAIPVSFAWAIGRQAVEGLAEAHKQGITHRDVKPGNFLLGVDGHVKVADLGLAMVKNGRKRPRIDDDTKESIPAGTAAYMAPEQGTDPLAADFRADIYSLGVTLYHALTGRLPFEGRSAMEVIMKHLRFAPMTPREYAPDLSEECSNVILRMLAKNPEDRFASYDELRMAMAQAIGDRRAPRPLAEAFLTFAGTKR